MFLPKKWLEIIEKSPEAGMGYQIANVVLKDGKTYERVMIIEGRIIEINGNKWK
jgi:hypothetical protein